MLGLLLKDIYLMRKYLKMHFVISVIFIASSFFSDNIMFAALPIMLAGSIPITLLAYDERDRWLEYCGSLPCSRAQIVSAKYLLGLAAQTVTSFVVYFALAVKGSGDWVLLTVLAIFIMSLVTPMICMPFALKYGTEKGRVAFYFSIAVVTGLILFTAQFAGGGAFDFTDVMRSTSYLPMVYMFGISTLYVLSWIESILIYNKKEKAE